ncbi:MAG: hypothetical protein LCH93_06955 [Proteobacteria bacterium]|nr:hypothetical protein [Pseudomonadota bacterium]
MTTDPSDKPTATTVAEWMAAEFHKEGWLDQETAAGTIIGRFGDEFVYENANGNLSIQRAVLQEFQRLTATTAIWVRSDRAWRKRDKNDGPSRQT